MYATIVQCNGWYYANKGIHGEDQVFPVAVWALTDEGEVVGLVAVGDGLPEAGNKEPRLIAPAPGDGTFLTKDQLSESQRASLTRGVSIGHAARF